MTSGVVVGLSEVAPVYVRVPSLGLTVDAFWKRTPNRALPSIGTGCPLGPERDVAMATRYGGIPYTPGAVLGPNSKTTRSKPGLWAIRIAVSWAWFAVAPPVRSGQAVAGVLPGLAAEVGLGAAAVGAAVGETVGDAVLVAVGAAVGGAAVTMLALGLVRGRTTRSGLQALTTSAAVTIKSALHGRRRPLKASIVTHGECSVEFADKLASPSYADRTKRA